MSIAHWAVMPLTVFSVFTVVLLLSALRTDHPSHSSPSVDIRIKPGDDSRWAARDWDDSDWAVADQRSLPGLRPFAEFPAHAGIYWVRFRLERSTQKVRSPVYTHFVWPADEPGAPINSVFLAAVFSFELYWDGRLIGRGGKVGADYASEEPGPLDNLMLIPDELLSPGPHVVALRMSSYHYNFSTSSFDMAFAMENFMRRLVYETRQPILPMLGVGGAALVAAICAVLFWFVDRRRPLFLCGALGLAIAVFYTLIAWRWLHNDRYDWLYPRYVAIAATMAVICVLLPWLLLEQFSVPRRRWWFITLALLLAAVWTAVPWYQVKALWMCRATLVFSLAVATWAVRQRRTGAWLALGGLLAGLASVRLTWDTRMVLTPSFFLLFGLLVLALFCALGLQMREDRRRAQQATLTAARLEIELLKKNIQPHFLMNTLTTIMEVIEHDPPSALTLIEALAAEFRILARVSGEKLIPLGQELELCRAHIRIMGLRNGVECALDARDVDPNSPVPPALFHTLVEGGFTHQVPQQGRLKFVFDARYEPGRACYTLVVHGGNPPLKRPPEDGTGLRYVKARLEESFEGRWSFTAGPVPEGWRTVIEIKVLPGEEALA